MNAQRFVLCLVLLASGLGFAQAPGDAPPVEPSTSPPPLVPAPPSPPPLVPAPAQPEEPVPEGELIPRSEVPRILPSPRFSPGNVAIEALGGLVGGMGLGIGAALALGGLFSASGDCDATCGLVAAVLALPAVAIGIPLGVYVAGELIDGEGRFLPAFGGMLAGVGGALLLALTGSSLVTTLAVLTFPIAGAVIGYELSRPDAPPMQEEDGYGDEYSSTGFQVVPVLGVTPGGGFVGGLSGRF